MESVKFTPCSFMEAMGVIDNGGRARIASLPQGLYFKKVKKDLDDQIWLCARQEDETHGIVDVRVRVGMAIMGNESWEKEVM